MIAHLEIKQSETDIFAEIFKRVAAIKPLTYHGKEGPASLKYWIREFNKLFDAIVCPENVRVSNVIYSLRDEIELWWKHKKRIIF